MPARTSMLTGLRRRLRAALAALARRSKTLPRIGATSTGADVVVTPERTLQIGAVYSCVRLLSESAAMLPIGMYRRTGTGRVKVPSHPLLDLLTYEPNPVIDAGEYVRTILGWMLLRGNGYAYVQRGGGSQPVALWPIAPTSIDVRRAEDGTLVYQVILDQLAEYAPIREKDGLVRAENMLHYRAFGLGIEGLSPIGLARQQVGISYAAMAYIGGFFARDASPGGTVSVPGNLSDDQFKRLEAQWRDLHEGFDRSHRLAVLEGGAKWDSVSLSPVDAAFLDTYKMTRSDIAGIYGVPPHMIGDVERSTSWGTGIEQQSLGYVIYTLLPWLVRIEKVTARLLRPDRDLYLRFNTGGLLRGDITARYAAYAQGRQWGWLSANDVRRREDDDPIPDGDTYLQPLNMVPAGTLPADTGRCPVHPGCTCGGDQHDPVEE